MLSVFITANPFSAAARANEGWREKLCVSKLGFKAQNETKNINQADIVDSCRMHFYFIRCSVTLDTRHVKGKTMRKFLAKTKRPGARFSKVPKTFWARKAIRKTTTCLLCKAGLFICCKANKNKNNCKVSCLETPSFWRYKKDYGTRYTSEKFRNFRETGPWAQFLIARLS